MPRQWKFQFQSGGNSSTEYWAQNIKYKVETYWWIRKPENGPASGAEF